MLDELSTEDARTDAHVYRDFWAWARHDPRRLAIIEQGCETRAGTVGDIYLRAMRGIEPSYYNDPEKTSRSRRGDYYTIGDMGYLDDEGYLFLVDRRADMIISGGVNIYPAEIEAALLEHPKVADAAVFGIPDEEWGEAVKAVIELKPGVQAGDAIRVELQEYCRRILAKCKIPRSFDFAQTLPRADNGKIYKRRLRAPYWEAAGRRI